MADFLKFVLKNLGFLVVLSYKPLSYKKKACINFNINNFYFLVTVLDLYSGDLASTRPKSAEARYKDDTLFNHFNKIQLKSTNIKFKIF